MTAPRTLAPDAATLREARRLYFEENGFGDGGYDEPWVKLQAGPIPIFLPNTSARVAAVRRHDLHHVVTGYATTWTGEGEIGAWELAAGCGTFWAAWVLNLQALAIGMVIAPGAMLRALARGRRSRTLYRGEFDEAWLDRTVGEMRTELALDRAHASAAVGAGDVASFVGWTLAAAATAVVTLAVTLAPVIAVGWLLVRVLG